MIDTTSLFLHVLAAIGILSGAVLQLLAGFRLRAADTIGDIATWARFTRSAAPLIVGSAVVSLATGGHLAGAVWTTETRSGFAYPFITLGAAGLVLLAPIGPMLGGARLRRLIAAAHDHGENPGQADPDLLRAVRARTLWGPIHSLLGLGAGLVALMVYKPGWVAGVALLLVSFSAGWLLGVVLGEPTTAAPSRTFPRTDAT